MFEPSGQIFSFSSFIVRRPKIGVRTLRPVTAYLSLQSLCAFERSYWSSNSNTKILVFLPFFKLSFELQNYLFSTVRSLFSIIFIFFFYFFSVYFKTFGVHISRCSLNVNLYNFVGYFQLCIFHSILSYE